MDRISNNEGIIICSVLPSLACGVNNIARLYIYTVLSVDNAIRHRIQSYNTYESMVDRESRFEQALNRKFNEFQPVFLNAMTMLLMTGLVENLEGTDVSITKKGEIMAKDLCCMKSFASKEIKEAVEYIHIIANKKDTQVLYNDLKLVL